MRKNIGVFRGKRKDNGEWIEGFFTCATDCCGRSYFIDVPRKDPDDSNHRYEIDSETVCEFTGLTDENDVRIFEGDIIRRKRVDGNWYNYEVFWWENCWGIKGGAEGALLILPPCGLQVIGNIHDNPELVGGDDNAAD